MPRYRLRLEYDGTPFRGWQRQAEGLSVQAAVEEAVLRLTGQPAEIIGAGRTDSGVHAIAQAAHLDLGREWSTDRIVAGLNAHLRPLPIVCLEAREVPGGFHARFDAVRRCYVYRILNRRPPPALESNRCWHLPLPLDAEQMHEAGQALIGRHDFTSYRSSECQAPSPVKTLDLLHVQRRGDWITVRLAARSFLHHQVRNIMGTLRLVGEGKAGLDHAGRVLEACDRSAAGQTAPAAGLFLEAVDYPA